MAQSVTDKTPIPVTTWRRHDDPPGLWVAVVISSVILHLPLVWLLTSSGLSMAGRKFSSRPIPIEYIAVLPSQQTSKNKPIAVVPPKVQPKPKPVEVKPKTIITQPPVEKKEPSIAQATLPDAITFTNLDDIKKANLSPKVKKTPLNPPIKPKVASPKPLPPKQPTLNQEKQRQNQIAQLQRIEEQRRQNLIAQLQRQQDERRQNQIAQQQRIEEQRRQNQIAQQQRIEEQRRQNQIAQQQRIEEQRRQDQIAQQQRIEEQRRQDQIAQQRQQDEKKRKQLIAQLQQQDKLRRQQQIDEQRRKQEVANNQTEVQKSSTPVIVDAEPPPPPPGTSTTEEGTGGFLTASLFVKPQQVQQDLNSTPGNVLKTPPQLTQTSKTPIKLPLLDDTDKQRVTKPVKCGVLLSIDANGKIFSPKEGFSGIRANSDAPGMQDICQRYAEEYFQQNKENIKFIPGQDVGGKLAAGQILTDITIQPAGAR